MGARVVSRRFSEYRGLGCLDDNIVEEDLVHDQEDGQGKDKRVKRIPRLTQGFECSMGDKSCYQFQREEEENGGLNQDMDV
jgi:hypothetical protein